MLQQSNVQGSLGELHVSARVPWWPVRTGCSTWVERDRAGIRSKEEQLHKDRVNEEEVCVRQLSRACSTNGLSKEARFSVVCG